MGRHVPSNPVSQNGDSESTFFFWNTLYNKSNTGNTRASNTSYASESSASVIRLSSYLINFSLLYFFNQYLSELEMTGGTCVADDGRKWANNVFAELVLPSVETFFKINSPLTP